MALTKVGDCEVCDKTNIKITCTFGNIWMCDECKEREEKLQAENMKPENQSARVDAVNSLVSQSKRIDESIQVKTELFNAQTVAAVEIKGAIEADENIPAEDKQLVYANRSLDRFKHFQELVFEDRKRLQENENAMRFWQIQVQQSTSTLRAELREKFKQFDVNYQPAPPKTVKPAAPKTPKKFQKEEVRKYALQYKVPEAAVQMVVVAKNMAPEAAAKHLAVQMGLIKE